MSIKQTIARLELKPLQIIAVLAVLQLFITLFSNNFALSADEAMAHYIGRNWFRNGLVPYSGGVDNKSPFFYAVYGVSDLLFGVNYWFPRVFGTFCQSVGIYFLYKIAKNLAGERAGILTISFYGLSLLWHCTDARYTSYTETFDVLFVILAVYFFIVKEDNKSFFISGLLAAIGLAFRLSAIFAIATLIIASLYKKRSSTLLFCLGLISGIGLLAAICVLSGINLHEMYVYALADNFGPGSTSDHYLLWKWEQAFNMFYYSELVLFYPLVLAYLLIKKRSDWLIVWLVLEIIGINIIGNYARVDLKDALPAFSLISAIAVAHLIDTYHIPMTWVMFILWVCFFPKLLEPVVTLKRVFMPEPYIAENYTHEPFMIPDEQLCKRLGLWVRDNTSANEKVFIAGYGAQVQVYTERVSPSIYFNATQTQIAKDRFYRDMQQNKPTMILVPQFALYKTYIGADLRGYVDSLVTKNYSLYKCLYSYNVYKIKR
jgi:hypothetical protein